MSGRVDPTICPTCGGAGSYDGRVLVDGRGIYSCRCGTKWQDMDEKPRTKGYAPVEPRSAR